MEWLFWSEVYTGYDLEKFLKIKQILSAQGLPIKEKETSLRRRMADNIIGGADPLYAHTGGAKDTNQYQVFAKKEDFEKAKKLLRDAASEVE